MKIDSYNPIKRKQYQGREKERAPNHHEDDEKTKFFVSGVFAKNLEK